MREPGPQRRALGNRDLVALTSSHGLGISADKTSVIGVLVYAYDRAGAEAASFTAFILFVPLLFIGPVVSRALAGHRPNRARAQWHAAQAVFLGLSGILAIGDAPLWAVIATMLAASVSTAIMRPAVAMLSPAVVRSADELVVANLWITYVSSSTSLIAPVVAATLLAVGGAGVALLGAAALAAVSLAVMGSMSAIEFTGGAETGDARGSLREGITTVARLPGGRGLIVAGMTHQALLTVMGIVAVIVAVEQLDLGASGPGWLNLAFGIGAVGASPIVSIVLRRQRLAPMLLAAVAGSAVAYALLGGTTSVAVAVVLFGVFGITRVAADVATRVMLQRVLRPDELGGAFTVLQVATAAGGALSALAMQFLTAAVSIERASAWMAVALAVITVGLVLPLRRADATEPLPLVRMSLLRQVTTFAGLGGPEVELLARHAMDDRVAGGSVVLRAGDPGETFHVVVDGRCSVEVADEHVRDLERGHGFGEVALLADVPRTATVRAEVDTTLLSIDRSTFLTALTGSADAERAVWSEMQSLRFAPGTRPGDRTD